MIAALLLAVQTASGPPEGIALGTPVSLAFRALGSPLVRNTAVGHVWVFSEKNETVRVTTDGAGDAEMVDVAAQGAPDDAFTVPGTPLVLRFGLSTSLQAASALAPFHDFSTTANDPDGTTTAIAQGYRLGKNTELVLLFNPVRSVLQEAFYGTRSELSRAGLIPGPVSTDRFMPARIEHLGAVAYNSAKQGQTYVRIAVSATGAVTDASVFVSSGDANLDRIAVAAAYRDTFTPAMRSGVAVPSIYFFRETFARSGP